MKFSLKPNLLFFKKLGRLTEKMIHSIPKFIWTSAAIFGLFLFGYAVGQDTAISQTEYDDQVELSNKYMDVIKEYERLSRMYYDQGEEISNVLDRNTPIDRIPESLDTIDTYRDLIIYQQGRITALREKADLPPEEFTDENEVNTN